MKKTKNMFKKSVKLIVAIVIVLLLTGGVVYAAQEGYLYDSDEVSYDNTSSGLTSTNLQSALDELNTKANTVNTKYTTCSGDLSTCQTQLAALQQSVYVPSIANYTTPSVVTFNAYTLMGSYTFSGDCFLSNSTVTFKSGCSGMEGYITTSNSSYSTNQIGSCSGSTTCTVSLEAIHYSTGNTWYLWGKNGCYNGTETATFSFLQFCK